MLSRILLGLIFVFSVNPTAKAAPNADGEEVPADEAQAIKDITDIIRSGVQEGFNKDGHAYRDAHRKAHGCVEAKFTVLDNLPADLAKGVFAKPLPYDAIIRYSNGSGKSEDDHEGDGRGMAIKLLGVGGDKILEDEPNAKTQDFLMINHPVFFVRNAADYVGFQKAASSPFAPVPLLFWIGTHILHEGAIINAIRGKTVTNPLNSRYWSMTPSKLGSRQMKFSADPCLGQEFKDTDDSNDRLRLNMENHLKTKTACFDFKVQLRENGMPIEDPTIDWSEDASHFVKVAKIIVAAKPPTQGEACESLSYTPWHSLPEMRPLGGIQRVRKEVYLQISKLRHTLNNQKRVEP